MELRILSVVGGALNFGGRRMETIMRVAWLPVVLLLLVEMATVFGFLSVAAGRLVTFSDVASYAEAKLALARYIGDAWAARPTQMWIVNGSSLFLQAILVASFMAPLIRYAGLGERPAPGTVRLPFGIDQIRYLFAGGIGLIMPLFIFLPIGATAYYVFKYVLDALSKTYANFPNPDSLHTIELVAGKDLIAEQGGLWLYQTGMPLAVAAPFALLFWATLIAHFHPKNLAGGAAGGLAPRALGTLVVGGALVALAWAGLASRIPNAAGPEAAAFVAILAIGAVFALYVSLRVAPYQGIAVCRRSFAFGGTLGLTRGWNILRMIVVLLLVPVVIYLVLVLLNLFAVAPIVWSAGAIYAAADSYGKLMNGGETVAWIYPAFVWATNGLLILLNIFVAFFNYGVTAGLLGALYRESERKGD